MPLRGNYISKIPIFLVFGAVNPHPWTDQGEIWQGGADLSAPPCQKSLLPAKNPKIGRE